jgi:hypothetical protein
MRNEKSLNKEDIVNEMSTIYYDINSAKKFTKTLKELEISKDLKPILTMQFGFNSFSTRMEAKTLISFLNNLIRDREEYLNELTNKLKEQI